MKKNVFKEFFSNIEEKNKKTKNIKEQFFYADESIEINVKTYSQFGALLNCPFLAFTGYGQSTQNGIYPVYLYYIDVDTIVLAYGISEKNVPALQWNVQNRLTIGDFFSGKGLRPKEEGYDSSFVYKTYKKQEILGLNDDELDQDLQKILEEFKRRMENRNSNKVEFAEQKILFGAPGTGKSNKIDNGLFKKENGSTYGLKSVSQDCKFRTTFHPDYDYAQFIGSYKPKKDKENPKRIVYEFVPQVFAKAYVAAWNKFIAAGKKSTADNQVYLVIEEINRGNCAQIFGDLFQLLDRDDNGYSSYEIDADADFAEWIKKQLDSSAAPKNNIPDGIRSGCKLCLPPNFNILATMNTSDQSLFPMDSAFKRRFDWEYVPIDFEGKDCADYQIEVGGEKPYSWQKFVESVNEKIFSITDSEDKQLGEYFIKLNPADNNVITKERFLGKVMFYLWNEVCKDVHKQESFFREEESGRYFTFQDLYKKDGDKKLIKFMEWITAKKEEMS